ncbi:hypothetical protein ACG2LH_02050 [Zhouia sp. PK063]|uniref:hypothetical protein n=1 Tax=Zhouia sp. PK063 TaxID=3373602 RepID=UPI003787D0D0
MKQNPLFNLSTSTFNNYEVLFGKFILAILIVYVLILVLSFLRDKFINTEATPKSTEVTDLLLILNKIFFLSGFGFIAADFINAFIHGINSKSYDWNYIGFGLILIFVSISVKQAYETIKKV